jgi:hypothetical protein
MPEIHFVNVTRDTSVTRNATHAFASVLENKAASLLVVLRGLIRL